ncbi:hypothetical protein AVEN_133284-1 [Araneus ventricosus]|uniref:Uncharacterized protein n=1 Tax=Araneus ventricosus TaxID=182803 RepID=A0A4Y2DMH7_ARAVE|nr:hypothetical protein AVEN_133284-1 [Araneus ventricosus]
MLSLLDYDQEIPSCEENKVSIDFPARSPMEIRGEQLKDEDLRKIIHCFENDNKDVNHANCFATGIREYYIDIPKTLKVKKLCW